jgi:hypothetical protein
MLMDEHLRDTLAPSIRDWETKNPTQSLITIILVAINKEDFGKTEFIFILNL